jgi:hypothetical protein
MAAAETVLVMDFSDSKIHSLNFGKADRPPRPKNVFGARKAMRRLS